MLVRGVVDDEFGDDAQAARVRRVDEGADVVERAVVGADVAIFGDVVAVVAARARVEGQQPDRRDAEIDDVIELGEQPLEIADPVIVGIEEGFEMQLIDDRILVPQGIGRGAFDVGHAVSPGAMRQMR